MSDTPLVKSDDKNNEGAKTEATKAGRRDVSAPTPTQTDYLRAEECGSVRIDASPIPHPSLLKDYAKLIPDAPERFLAMVENEQKQQFALENSQRADATRLVPVSINRVYLGMGMAFVIAVLALIAGTLLVASDKGVALAGVGIAITPVTGMLTVFLYTSRRSSQEYAPDSRHHDKM